MNKNTFNKEKKSLINSFNYAIQGLMYSLLSQKNMRIHYVFAIVVIIAMLFFDLNKIEFAIVFMSTIFVVFAELVNTSIESIVDLVTDEFHPMAKIAKDVAAGSVVVSAINAVVVGYIVFFNKLNLVTLKILTSIRHQSIHLVFLGSILILICVVAIKTFTKSGTPMQGGFVSGHSALGFGLATAISILSENTLVTTMAFLMAFLVAQSRVEGKIHSKRETFFGAILGISIMIILFKFFKI